MGLLGNLTGFFGSLATYGVASAYSSAQRKKQIDASVERMKERNRQEAIERAAQRRAKEEVEAAQEELLEKISESACNLANSLIDSSAKKRTCFSCYYSDCRTVPNCKNPANLIIKNGEIYLRTDLNTCDCWKYGYDEDYNWLLGYDVFKYTGDRYKRYFSDTDEYKKECERLLSGYTALETDEEREAFRKEFRKPYITLKGEEE